MRIEIRNSGSKYFPNTLQLQLARYRTSSVLYSGQFLHLNDLSSSNAVQHKLLDILIIVRDSIKKFLRPEICSSFLFYGNYRKRSRNHFNKCTRCSTKRTERFQIYSCNFFSADLVHLLILTFLDFFIFYDAFDRSFPAQFLQVFTLFRGF